MGAIEPTSPAETVEIPATRVPVVLDTDICVVGGSCTGVFAAVRAARLGARVAIVEKQNCFGGVATNGLVNIWHNMMDEPHEREIIRGLSTEVIDRLEKRDAVHRSNHRVDAFMLNTEELKVELDELVREHRITPFLHTMYASPLLDDDGRIAAIVVQTISGAKAIRATQFIDATGDGHLARSIGCELLDPGSFQPPTTCAKIQGMQTLGDFDWKAAIREHGHEFGLEPDWGWQSFVPGLSDIRMHADTHVFGLDTAKSDMLTASEMEGRRKVRAIMDVIRAYGPSHSRIGLVDIASAIGVRETHRIRSSYTMSTEDVLDGRRFQDAIANGSYRVDIHHDNRSGITFRYLDGTEVVIPERGAVPIKGRWRDERADNPTFYQVPLRSLVQLRCPNLMLAGRMLGADKTAFSAVRVMINMNQTGEAAGTAAYIALDERKPVQEVDSRKVRKLLADGGSIVI